MAKTAPARRSRAKAKPAAASHESPGPEAAVAPKGTPRGLVVALDGPASSGKSSVGAAASAKLGYRFCDTGLLYRAVTWLALDRDVPAGDPDALVALVGEIELVDDGGGRLAHVAVGGVDRTAEVRGPDVDVAVSAFSSVPELRAALLQRQRALAADGRIVMAGRDIGTVVLPDADLKLYLDASVEERARRRVLERGIDPSSKEAAEILGELRRRDLLDSTREVAPLRQAKDAVVIRTDGNAFETTVELVVAAIRSAEEQPSEPQPKPPPEALPVAGTSATARTAATPARPERARRGPRRPMRQTPVATRPTLFIRLGSALLRMIVRAMIRLRVDGDLAAIPREGSLIIAANHASSADPVLIGAFLNSAIDRPLNWLGKRELTEFWATGWAFRRAGIHPVDRHAGDIESFRTAMRILEAGQILAVFPEGTRSRDGALQPVREGVGVLALRSGAQVLPVAVIDSDLAWPRGRLLPHWGKRVTVRYGTPFDVSEALASRAGGAPKDRKAATEAATRLVMTRIAELLPPRQRGIYAADVEAAAQA